MSLVGSQRRSRSQVVPPLQPVAGSLSQTCQSSLDRRPNQKGTHVPAKAKKTVPTPLRTTTSALPLNNIIQTCLLFLFLPESLFARSLASTLSPHCLRHYTASFYARVPVTRLARLVYENRDYSCHRSSIACLRSPPLIQIIALHLSPLSLSLVSSQSPIITRRAQLPFCAPSTANAANSPALLTTKQSTT